MSSACGEPRTPLRFVTKDKRGPCFPPSPLVRAARIDADSHGYGGHCLPVFPLKASVTLLPLYGVQNLLRIRGKRAELVCWSGNIDDHCLPIDIQDDKPVASKPS